MFYKHVMKRVFAHWPYYRSSASRIGFWIAAIARGQASGQYSNSKANTTALRPLTGPVWKHPFHNIIIFSHWRLESV